MNSTPSSRDALDLVSPRLRRAGAWRSTSSLLRAGAVALAALVAQAGCAAGVDEDIYFGDADPADVVTTAADDSELARFELETGRVVLVAEPGGGVGVAETTPYAVGVAEHLVEVDGATPLEVFLALSQDDAEPPAALVADHLAATDAAPRKLAAPISTAVLSGFYDCNSADWSTWHAGATASYQDRQALFNTTSGDILFTGVINGQYARRFDACAGNNISDHIKVYIDRKSSGAAVYSNILLEQVFAYQRFYYTSLGGSYPDWRMRVQRPSSGSPKSYGAAGAWSPLIIVIGL